MQEFLSRISKYHLFVLISSLAVVVIVTALGEFYLWSFISILIVVAVPAAYNSLFYEFDWIILTDIGWTIAALILNAWIVLFGVPLTINAVKPGISGYGLGISAIFSVIISIVFSVFLASVRILDEVYG